MISIQSSDFSFVQEYEQLNRDHHDGAIVTFVGKVRSFEADSDDLNTNQESITLEHYPKMTEKVLNEIILEAKARWKLNIVRVIHRVGTLKLGEQIVFIGVTSAHRQDAFEGCQFIIDYLKQKAPFWKKENSTLRSEWVLAKESDVNALSRWKIYK